MGGDARHRTTTARLTHLTWRSKYAAGLVAADAAAIVAASLVAQLLRFDEFDATVEGTSGHVVRNYSQHRRSFLASVPPLALVLVNEEGTPRLDQVVDPQVLAITRPDRVGIAFEIVGSFSIGP